MKFLESRLFWGGLLILAGILFLIQNLGGVRLGDLFWAIVFFLAGLFFSSIFIQSRGNWWALIPSITLLSIGVVVLLYFIAPQLGEIWSRSIVLGGVGLSFLAVYIVERHNWWALIPGGVLLTLAAVAGLDQLNSGLGTAGVFFLGLGLTFALVAILPTPQGHMRWAWIPSGLLLLAGGIFLIASEELLRYFWPVILILFGGFLIFRAFRHY
jgi:hypothetical protein